MAIGARQRAVNTTHRTQVWSTLHSFTYQEEKNGNRGQTEGGEHNSQNPSLVDPVQLYLPRGEEWQ